MKLISLNEYLYESNQNLVHYLSCQAGCYTYSVLRILISAPAICIKTLASRVQALAFRVDALLLALSFSFFLLLSYFNLDAHLHVVFRPFPFTITKNKSIQYCKLSTADCVHKGTF